MKTMKLSRKSVGKFLLFFSWGLITASVVFGLWMRNVELETVLLINYDSIGVIPLYNYLVGLSLFFAGFMLFMYEPPKS